MSDDASNFSVYGHTRDQRSFQPQKGGHKEPLASQEQAEAVQLARFQLAVIPGHPVVGGDTRQARCHRSARHTKLLMPVAQLKAGARGRAAASSR